MKRVLLAIPLVAITRAAALADARPSFDCGKAHSTVEKLICSNDELARLDRELADAYRRALQEGTADKEQQIAWIRRNDECVGRDSPEQCLRDRLEQRIRDLRRTSISPEGPATSREVFVHPTLAETQKVCDHVASRGWSIADELIKDGELEAKNDGTPYAVSIGSMGGTMGGEQPEFRPKGAPSDVVPIEVAQKGFEWNDYGPLGAGWLKWGKYVYTLYFDTERHRHPLYLGLIDPVNVEHLVCDFTSVDEETLYPERPQAERLCNEVAGDRVRFLDLTPASAEEQERDIGRAWTRLDGWLSVDFRNTGRRESLALLAFEGTAGRGCEFSYYDAAEGGNLTVTGEAHDLLMKLQRVNLRAFAPGPTCDRNEPRWFESGGHTYLDNRPSRDVSNDTYHEVWQISGQDLRRMCYAATKTKVTVKSIWPHE